jgi:hypothetical protein
LDKATGVRSKSVAGTGEPPHTVSWEREEAQYRVVYEDPMKTWVRISIDEKGGAVTSEAHDLSCDASSDLRSGETEPDRYVDSHDLACSDDDERWKDAFSQFLAPKPKAVDSLAAWMQNQRGLVAGLVGTRKEGPGNWHLNTSVSSFDDSKTVVLTLTAINQITGWPGVTTTPMLALRCKEGNVEAYVSTGMQGKPEFGQNGTDLGVAMRGRYDKDKPNYYLMNKSTDGKMFFFPNPIWEIKSMLDHYSLVLSFTPFNSIPVEMHFDLTGLGREIKPLRDACSR